MYIHVVYTYLKAYIYQNLKVNSSRNYIQECKDARYCNPSQLTCICTIYNVYNAIMCTLDS